MGKTSQAVYVECVQMSIGGGVGSGLREAYQRGKERTPVLLDRGKESGWREGYEPGELKAGWALGKVSGQNDRIKNPGRMDGSKTLEDLGPCQIFLADRPIWGVL